MWFLRVLLAMCPLRKMLHLDNKSSFMAQNYSSMPFFSFRHRCQSRRERSNELPSRKLSRWGLNRNRVRTFLKSNEIQLKRRKELNWLILGVAFLVFLSFWGVFLVSLSKLKSLLLRLQCQCPTVHLWALLFWALLFVSTGFVSNAFCKHCFL